MDTCTGDDGQVWRVGQKIYGIDPPVEAGQRVRLPGRAMNEIEQVLGADRGVVLTVYQCLRSNDNYRRWIAIVKFDYRDDTDGVVCWADELEKI